MPTAQKFASRGVGNGFPSCPQKINVLDDGSGSPYDYWTTLSGWSAVDEPVGDAAKAASIGESLSLAMKVFWNVYSADAACDAFYGNTSTPVTETTSLSGINNSGHSRTEPKSRACGGTNASETDSSSQTQSFLSLSSLGLARLYDGVVTNEDNFIGYGVNAALVNSQSKSGGTRATARVTIMSFQSEYAGAGDFDYAYVSLGDIHFVCETNSRGGDLSTPNATAMTAYGEGSIGTTRTYTAYAEITSLDFYTY